MILINKRNEHIYKKKRKKKTAEDKNTYFNR